MTLCLIAAEKEAADLIRRNLVASGLYPDWRFEVCYSAEELYRFSEPVDVLVVSRFLPGQEAAAVLRNLRFSFPTAHVVLLAGPAGEGQRAYISAAHRQGFYNVVTGKLPGDRPYTIFAALKGPREPEQGEEMAEESPDAGAPAVPEAGGPGEADTKVEAAREAIAGMVGELKDIEAVRARLREILALLEGDGPAGGGQMQRTRRPSQGILVLAAANKGGVGKTTVAVALATALAKSGVPTVLVDYDLAAPDVAGFLGIKDVPGIEALAGKPLRRGALRDLVVQKGSLYVLPGPMDRTLPAFARGQLLEITSALLEMYAVVVGDTPPEYWAKPWLAEIFARADYVLAVVDQSVFSEQDTRNYAPYLLSMGVLPERIGIVLNRYSPKLHSPRVVERAFCAGFRKEVKTLPRVVAVIPEDWEAYVQKGYRGEVAGLEDVSGQWHRLAERVAGMAGYSYRPGVRKKRLGGLFSRVLHREAGKEAKGGLSAPGVAGPGRPSRG